MFVHKASASLMNTALARSFVDFGAVARSATQRACTQLLLKLLKRRAKPSVTSEKNDPKGVM